MYDVAQVRLHLATLVHCQCFCQSRCWVFLTCGFDLGTATRGLCAPDNLLGPEVCPGPAQHMDMSDTAIYSVMYECLLDGRSVCIHLTVMILDITL